MTEQPYALVLGQPHTVARMDWRHQQTLDRVDNRMRRVADIYRAAMDEMTINYLAAKDLAVYALATGDVLQRRLPHNETMDGLHASLAACYVRAMIAVVENANEAIQQCADESLM